MTEEEFVKRRLDAFRESREASDPQDFEMLAEEARRDWRRSRKFEDALYVFCDMLFATGTSWQRREALRELLIAFDRWKHPEPHVFSE